MKQSYCLRFILLIGLFTFFITAEAQQCSISTNVNGIGGVGSYNFDIGQSFTACQSGRLASVTMGKTPAGSGSVRVQVRSGDGASGTVLLTTNFENVGGAGTKTFNLSTHNLILNAGAKYTIFFLPSFGDTPQILFGNYANAAVDYYSGGRLYGPGASHNDMFGFNVKIDLLNKTLSPLDDAVEVSRDTEVKVDFSRNMVAASGNITINNTTDATSATVDVTTLTINGTEVLMPLDSPLLGGKDFEIIIPANVLESTDGMPFTGIAAGEWTFSTSTKPFAVLSTTSADLSNDPTFPFTIDFSDAVTGFELADFVITNGTASNLAGSSDASFTFDVTPTADGEVVVSLPAGKVEAGATNGNDSTGYALEYDGTAPSVSLATDASGTIQSSIFDIEVVFSEPVTGFETSDLQVVNADILSSTSTKDSLFTISLQAQAEGQITIDLPSAIADDLAGNTNTAAPAIIDITFSVDLESGLLSYYPFDGNANDTVSTGFNGTLSGPVLTTGFDGTADAAYSFDGNDIITFGDTPIGAGSFTVAFWVKIPDGITQNQARTILGKRAVCGEGRFFEINYVNSSTTGHTISVEQRNNASVANPNATFSNIGEWMHVAYVKDNEQSQSSFFINGVQQTPVAWTSAYSFENNDALRIGVSACNGSGRSPFIGDLDEMHVYGRALTQVEVDLLVPFGIQSQSKASGSSISALENIEIVVNKNIVQSSVNTTNITATASASGALNAGIASSQDTIVVSAPTSGWPIGEDITISLSNILAVNGTTLPDTDLTYSVVADEAVGLILHYPINGNANEVIGDISGQDGTISGALFTEGIDGNPFGALSFDGVDDVVTLGDAPISTASFSYSLWVKIPNDGSETTNTIILSKREACTEGRMFDLFYLRSGDKVRFSAASRSNASNGGVSTGFDYPVNEWINVQYVMDTQAKQTRLIVNGVLEGEANWLLSAINLENNAPIRLGATPCNGVDATPRFDGSIDDFRIYDRILKPRVVSIEPSRGTVGAAIDTVITITFDRAVDVNSLETTTISVTDANDISYPYSTAFSNGDSLLTITPDADFPKGKTMTVSVDTLSAQIGSDFLPFKTSFTTVKSQILSHLPANGLSDVDSLRVIAFKFDNDINESSLVQGIQIIGSQHGPVQGVFTMPTADSVVFTPSRAYFPNEIVTVYVTPSLEDVGGESIGNTKTFTFHVGSPQFVNPTLSFELTKLTTSISTSLPRDLVAADLDNDGDLDLIGGDENPGTLFWFENQGFGKFSTGNIIDSNNDYWDIEATDFDFDGDMDIVTISRVSGKGVYWYENNGSTSFTEHQIKSLSGSSDLRALKAADFNNDGSMDVVTVDYGLNRLTAYDKDGTELFAAANVGGPLDVQIADRENDGDLDLYLANYTSGNVATFTNSGFATFSGSALHSATHMRTVIPIDFDKDGDIDIVYAAQTASQIGILENTGSGYTNHQVGSVGGPHRIDVGDIDGDGDFDIIYSVAAGNADINFYHLENNGSFGLWVPKKLIDSETFSGTFTQTVKFADIDNDGDLDVLATDASTGFYVFENKIIDVNNGPLLENPVADQSMMEDSGVTLSINVSNVFVDAEGDPFTLDVEVSDPQVTAVLSGIDLDIMTSADFFGEVTITLTADDGNGVNTDSFVLNVTSVNDAPVFDLSTSSYTIDEDFTITGSISVTQNQPANEDAPTYAISPTSVSFADVSIDATTGAVSIISIADGFGTQEFTVTADDGASADNTASQTFTLIVNAVNDAPIVANAISDISFDEDSSGKHAVDLPGTFSDVDDVSLTLAINVLSGSDLATLTLTNDIINIAPVADAFGTIQVEVTAEDDEGLAVTDQFDIIINPVNDAPTFTTSGDLTLFSNSTSVETVTVFENETPFGEADQVVTYSLSPASVSFANVSIDQATGVVSITTIADTDGTQEFTITADDGQAENNMATQTFTLTVINKIAQTVTFTGVANKTFGDADFEIVGSVDSSLPIAFTVISGGLSITESAIGISGGGSADFTIIGAGTAILQASNDGDDTYAPYQETITIEIAKADQTVTVESITNKSVAAQPITVVANVNTDLTLDYSVTGPATNVANVITLEGTVGTVTVTVSQAGNDNYNMASATTSFEVVAKQSQTITFDALSDVTYGAADIVLGAVSSASLPVTFSLIGGNATLSGNTLTVNGIGEVIIEASQEGNEDFLAAAIVQQSFMVAKAPLQVTADDKVITYGDDLPALSFSISGFVNGEGQSDLSSTLSVSTTATADAGTYPIEVVITAGASEDNYLITGVNGTLTVQKAGQTITVQPIDDKLNVDVPFDIVASVDSGLPLDFAITGPATITGTTITLSGTSGTITVTVSQPGDNNFNAAADVTVTFDVDEVLSAEPKQSKISVYPNPASHFVKVNTQKEVSIRFYTLDGTLALVSEKASEKIDISKLENGVYMLELIIDNEHTFQKFIKTN